MGLFSKPKYPPPPPAPPPPAPPPLPPTRADTELARSRHKQRRQGHRANVRHDNPRPTLLGGEPDKLGDMN